MQAVEVYQTVLAVSRYRRRSFQGTLFFENAFMLSWSS